MAPPNGTMYATFSSQYPQDFTLPFGFSHRVLDTTFLESVLRAELVTIVGANKLEAPMKRIVDGNLQQRTPAEIENYLRAVERMKPKRARKQTNPTAKPLAICFIITG